MQLFEKFSIKITDSIGTPTSVLIHTLIFTASFALILFGVSSNTIMLALTTAVSLESIYLSLFIQMTVNRQSKTIEEVEKDINEIQEDVEAIEDIQEDIHEEEIGTDKDFTATHVSLSKIESNLTQLSESILQLKSEIETLKSRSSTSSE